MHALAEAELVSPVAVGDMPTEVPPPSKSPVAPPEPAPTTAEQIVNPDPNVPGGAGLNPGVASSVAPRGTPAGPTEPLVAELMPNGEVSPIPGLPIPPTCAETGLQPRSVARVAAISSRRTVISIIPTHRSVDAKVIIAAYDETLCASLCCTNENKPMACRHH